MTRLTPAQQRGLDLAAGKPGYAWFMEMGLGKTLLALSEFLRLVREDKQATRLVVVCPNSFKTGWKEEIKKHGLHLDVHVLESSKIDKAWDFVDRGRGRFRYRMPPVLIVNYESVRLQKTIDVIRAFTHGRRAMLVIDESIALKNPQAQQSKAIRTLRHNFGFIRLLTGKPQTQGPHDLWAQLFSIGATTMTFYQFRGTFCKMGGWKNKQVIGGQNIQRLHELMAPYCFQAKKRDWLLGMPDKVTTLRRYVLTPVLRHHYDNMEEEFVAWVRDRVVREDKRVQATITLTKYRKLMQLMCGFIHDEEGEPMWLVPDAHNPRLNLLLEVLDETEGKVAIVYVHKFVGEQLQRAMTARGLNPAVIKSKADFEAEKAKFNDDATCRVILLQQQAAKYGHTLLGDQTNSVDACSTMVFYENSYSLDERAQVEDRIHRIGQKAQSCLYVDFVGASMDVHVIHALQRKESLFQTIMNIAQRP